MILLLFLCDFASVETVICFAGVFQLDVGVPRAPFLLMWSPSSQSLTYLSNAEGPGGATIRLSEILVAAARTPYKTKSERA